jgi:CDGSH-type Zn-finger protein/uncharacterized Fe-S cluster protein YjdI
MEQELHHYRGAKIDVTWDAKRCIHQAECTRRLGIVFDTGRRPWILPDSAEANQVAEVITHCPTGALHFTRKDGGASETCDPINIITPAINGPLFVRGEITIETPEGEMVLKDTRVALCRCGGSKNKPFCDKSHEEIGFEHDGTLGSNKARTDEMLPIAGPLKLIPSKNGPFMLRGPFEVRGKDQTCYTGNKVRLCRCGKSSNKPFCDDTHIRISFKSD